MRRCLGRFLDRGGRVFGFWFLVFRKSWEWLLFCWLADCADFVLEIGSVLREIKLWDFSRGKFFKLEKD